MRCRWDSPDGAHYVRLNCSVIEELRHQAVEASLALPRRGAEIGGLLLGKFQPGEPAAVCVEAVEEIACEHRYGPSYTLSDDDRARLREVLERPRPDGALQVVGFYRSYTRRDAAPDAADCDLFQTFLADERNAFLLIEPLPPAECYATFLFRIDGRIPDRSPYAFFSLDPDAMHVHEEEEAPAPATGPRVSAEPIAEDTPRPPAPAFLPSLPASRRIHITEAEGEPKPVPRARRRFWLPLAACIALGVGAALVYEFWKINFAPQWAELRMDATAANGDIHLSWDRLAPAVVLSSSGTLQVTDGPERKRIELTASDLRGGKLSYHPSHPEVLFRLELHSNRLRSWSDSVRVLSIAANPAPPAPPPPAAAPNITGEASRTVPPSRTERVKGRAAPAVAIHEVQPNIPMGIRSRIESRVVVPVEVRVSAAGKVVSAVARSKGDGVTRYLADMAAKSARSWRFTPARSSDGAPVASKQTIQFTFGPGAQ